MTTQWKIPPGMTHGTWDYVRGNQIAAGYDQFLKDDGLAIFELELLERIFPPIATERSPLVADFGVGTGRSLIPLVKRGYHGLAIDFSLPMLSHLNRKIVEAHLVRRIQTLQANLVELDGIEDQIADHGQCLFSTLGMIRGRESRLRFLNHVRRIVRPGGLFIVHAHNYFAQFGHPGGFVWGLRNLARRLAGSEELGDRFGNYRGINDLFIHSFRKSELSQELVRCGFQIREIVSFPENRSGWRGWNKTIGWFFVCG